MRNFYKRIRTGVAVAAVIMAAVCPSVSRAEARTIRENRTWVYQGPSYLKSSTFVSEKAYLYFFPEVTMLKFMEFDGTAEVNGKTYHRLAVKKTIHYNDCEVFYEDEEHLLTDPSIKTVVYSDERDQTMCYLREEGRKVYLLVDDYGEIAQSLTDAIEETVIYDWNLTDGDRWFDNPYLECRDNWRENIDPEDPYFISPVVEEGEPITIEGEECKVLTFPNIKFYQEAHSLIGVFVEGVGPLENGWLAYAYPSVLAGTETGVAPQGDINPLYCDIFPYHVDRSMLHTLLDGDGNVVYGKEIPDFSGIPRFYLYGEMNRWEIRPELQLTEAGEESGTRSYTFTCGEGIGIKAGQKFRISSADGLRRFGMPPGSAPLKLDETVTLVSQGEMEDIVLDGDWQGSLAFDFDSGTLRLTNAGVGVEGVTADGVDSGAAYDLMGREIRDPQPGTVYIRNGRKHVAR